MKKGRKITNITNKIKTNINKNNKNTNNIISNKTLKITQEHVNWRVIVRKKLLF